MHKTTIDFVPFFLFVLLLIACAGTAGTQHPDPSGPPVEAKFSKAVHPEFGKDLIGQRVRMLAAFAGLAPAVLLANGPDKYKSGWVRAMFGVAELNKEGKYECAADPATLSATVVSPTSAAADWANAKDGEVFELVAVIVSSSVSTALGSGGSDNLIEVESTKVVGKCATADGKPVE